MPSSTIDRQKQKRSVCTVTFSPEEVKAAEEKTLARLSQHVKLDGFRPGHAPIDKVRERIGADQLLEETLRVLMEKSLPALLDEHSLQPVIPPKVELTSRDPIIVNITLIESPEITIKGIDTLKIEKKEPKADPKDVKKVYDSVLAEHRTLSVVDRAAVDGDQVIIHFAAKDEEGKTIDGLTTQNYAVTIGSSRLLPGFEPELVGLKKGDKKSFTLTLPETYGVAEMRGKKVTFEVDTQRVEEVKLPELTDAFAKEKLQMDSAAGFTKMVETSILAQEKEMEDLRREKLLIDEIRNRTQVDLAPELIEEETKALFEEWERQLQERSIAVEDWLKRENKTPQEFAEELKTRSVERLKLRLGMAKVIELRKIQLSEDERKDVIEQAIAGASPEQRAEAEAAYAPGTDAYAQVIWRALVQKTIESFLAV